MKSLRATAPNPLRAGYSDPGGPWDGPPLDAIFAVEPAPATLLVDDHGARHSPGEVADHIARLAGALHAQGARQGSVVAWQLDNCADALFLPRACWRIGAVAAPIHHRAARADADRMIDALAPSLIVAPGTAAIAAGRDALEPDGSWRTAGEPIGTSSAPPVGDDDVSIGAVLFTSGSSGSPKAVLHDTRALAYKARTMVATHELGPSDAVLMPAPLAHVSGLLNGVLVPGAAPCKTVLMRQWDPARALEIIEAEAITFMVGPPTFFVSLMRDPSFTSDRVASLRLVSSGGAGVSATFCEDAERALGARVKRTYGSTEAPTIATSRHDDGAEAAHRYDGRAIGSVELRVEAPDQFTSTPTRHGELLVRGPELCLGYLDDKQTAEAFTDDGWFHTGDLATLDADGWLTIVGRLKEVVIRGGENISTAEVEEILERHPAISQACVVGAPDEIMGERICAFVVTVDHFDLDTARSWFEAQGAAKYKTPERLEQLDALPLLASGKPDRAALRARAATLR